MPATKIRRRQPGSVGVFGRRVLGFALGKSTVVGVKVISLKKLAWGLLLWKKTALLAVGAAATYLWLEEPTPFTGRTRVLLWGWEAEAGQHERHRARVEADTRLLSERSAASAGVRRVGRRIETAIRASPELRDPDGRLLPHVDAMRWSWRVLADQGCNALASPGGVVLVHDGLLRAVQRDGDAALAFVLAHEASHVVLRHAAEQEGVVAALRRACEYLKDTFGVTLPVNLEEGGHLPYSRRLELEADRVGLLLAARACYDPQGAVAAIRRLDGGCGRREEGGSHPSSGRRLKELEGQPMEAAVAVFGECSGRAASWAAWLASHWQIRSEC